MNRFRSRQYNFDENNGHRGSGHRGSGDYLRRNWRRLGRNLSFADKSFILDDLIDKNIYKT